MSGFTDQIDDRPMLLSLLEMIHSETGHLAPPQPATEQQGQDRPIPTALKALHVGGL